MFSKFLISLLFFSLVILTFFVPNSFTGLSFSVQVLLAFFLLFKEDFRLFKSLFYYWLIISVFFLFYIFISPVEILQQFNLILRYVVSPLTWLVIFHFLRFRYDYITIQKRLILFCGISCCTVIIFYFLFYNGLGDFLYLFIDEPNIDNLTGMGFRLHVYGVLIFFAMAIAPAVLSFKSNIVKIIYFILFLVATILSGRTALILSLFLGLSFFLFYLKKLNLFKLSSFVFVFGLIFFIYFLFKFEINSINYFDYLKADHLDKISEAGGEERATQLNQIFQKLLNFPFGNGFVSLQIVRNDINQWQYETLIPATLMRFGIFTIGIVMVTLYLICMRVRFNFSDQIGQYRLFLILGFISIFIASFTNPYLEAPAFQWMYIGPIVLLYKL